MSLRLSDQLCFPFYAITRALEHRYRPLLAPLGLTYPQYLVMLALWEYGPDSVGGLARRLHLEAPTLTPILQRMERAGLVARTRDSKDNRLLTISLTEAGAALEGPASSVPHALVGTLGAGTVDYATLKATLDRVLQALEPA